MNIDIQIERWGIERLIPQPNNPRTHSREQIAQIAASIVEFGFTNPSLPQSLSPEPPCSTHSSTRREP